MLRSRIYTTAVVVLVVGACSAAQLPNANSPGGRLYTANCASCHGTDAGGLRGPSLRSGLDAEYVEDIVTNGKGSGMPAFSGKLSKEDIRTLAVFVEDLGQSPSP
jgi:mono/diheme cytochrome c family protein